MENKCESRECSLDKYMYYSDNYFRLNQLCSFAHQINDIHRLNPASILEIGIGNGFTSSFLRRAGFDIVTVDINPELEPDICSPISRLKPLLGDRSFDLVVCCEVLEHMPFEDFELSLEVFRSVGQRLYMTLPNYKRVYGVGGFINLPKVYGLSFRAQFELPNRKTLSEEHFWEVGSSPTTTKREVIKRLGKFYRQIDTQRYALNPYHLSFYAFDN